MIGDKVVLPAVVGEAARVPFLLVLGGGLQSSWTGRYGMVLAVWRKWLDSN